MALLLAVCSLLRAATSFIGADASGHLLQGGLQGGGDSEFRLLVK